MSRNSRFIAGRVAFVAGATQAEGFAPAKALARNGVEVDRRNSFRHTRRDEPPKRSQPQDPYSEVLKERSLWHPLMESIL